ncbi:MAG: type II secretion system protein [Phycisphaerales bacterium]
MTTTLPSRRGFSLVEAMLSIVILGIIAASLAPTITAAADSYAQATAVRTRSERVGFAMERIVRLVRDVPLVESSTSLAASGTADSLTLSDGRGVMLTGSSLFMLDAAGQPALLCEGIDSFSLTYIADDGATATTAALCQRVHVSIASGGLTLNCAVLPRVRMTP